MIARVGLAPLTIVRRQGGTSQYVYQGQPAPTDGVAGELDRLVSEGYLLEVEVPDVEGDPVDGDPDILTVPTEKPLDEMDADELRRYAEDHRIDVGRASTVDGLRAKIADGAPAGV